MKLWAAFGIAIVLAGCSSGSGSSQAGAATNGGDAKVVGDWDGKFVDKKGGTNPGATLTLDNEHHFRELFRTLEIVGDWKLSGSTVTLTITQFSGMPIAQAKQKLEAMARKENKISPNLSIADNMDKPVDLTLSADGKQLSRPDEIGQAIYTKE